MRFWFLKSIFFSVLFHQTLSYVSFASTCIVISFQILYWICNQILSSKNILFHSIISQKPNTSRNVFIGNIMIYFIRLWSHTIGEAIFRKQGWHNAFLLRNQFRNLTFVLINSPSFCLCVLAETLQLSVLISGYVL